MSDEKRKSLNRKYRASRGIAQVGGREIPVEYLPVVDVLLQSPIDIDTAGTALFKVDKDLALMHLTDNRDLL